MHLLVPDVLVARETREAWLGGLALPGLERLLAHAQVEAREALDTAFQRTTPATRWLLARFGIPCDADRGPVAAVMRGARDGVLPEGVVWRADPVHFALARDHVALADAAPVLTTEEAQALAGPAREVVHAYGGALDTRDGTRWTLSHAGFDDMFAGEPVRALGRNVDPWMPAGNDDGARTWRRMHTEIQMEWHAHPVNQAREARGEAPVNAMWLWGGGHVARVSAPDDLVVDGDARGLAAALAALGGGSTAPLRGRQAPDRLRCIDALSAPMAHGDVDAFRETLAQLDRDVFAPIAQRERVVRLTLCGELGWRTVRAGARRGWFRRRTPVLEALTA